MQMEKPYDGHVLIEALKKEGVEGGIETAKKVVSVLADFLRSSAQMSTEGLIGKLDDFAVPGINYFEKMAIDELSKLEAKLEADPAPAIELEKAPEAAPSAPVQDPSAPQS